ncbi:MAG TPA: hypothetical protein VHY79_15865 [Rhizomicrobium sp.]|nr:hypothetical protein [Rhizomicrobium sp.]
MEFLTVTPKLPVPQFRRYATSQATDCGCAHDDDAAVDLECETVEALLGTAYQVKITAVVEAAVRLLGNPDHEIRGMSPRFNAKFSQVEVLWALGNYFKHRDEWDRSEWDTPTASRRFTIRALIAAGLEPSSSGNLREGATALGNAAFSEMAVFERIIDEWAAAIRTEVRC